MRLSSFDDIELGSQICPEHIKITTLKIVKEYEDTPLDYVTEMRKYRKSKCHTIGQVSKMIDVKADYLQKIEAGNIRIIVPEAMRKLLKYYTEKMINDDGIVLSRMAASSYLNIEDDIQDEVCYEYKSGKSSLRVAKIFNMSPSTVLKIIKHNNIPVHKSKRDHKSRDTNSE